MTSETSLRWSKHHVNDLGSQIRTVKGVATPEELLHVFGHDAGDILQLVIEFVEIGTTCADIPRILVQSRCLAHKRVYAVDYEALSTL